MFNHPVTAAHLDHALNARVHDLLPDARKVAAVREGYGHFIRATLDQWAALLPHFTFTPFDGVAYANSRDMIADATERRHLFVYPTDLSQMDEGHPMFAPVPDSLRVDGLPLVNDVFRAVHDLMGHVVSGGSFGVNGEARAWIEHRRSYSRNALGALWAETRGQASWTNAWADHAERPLPERPFATQKVILAPDHLA